MADAGVLLGIARKDAPRARMETLASTWIGLDCGVMGDHRGRVRPGKLPKRQVSVLAREDWETALAEIGADDLPWYQRRANLYVAGVDLPQRAGAVIAIGTNVRLQVMLETEPCSRMNDAWPGLEEALRPDWRGGVCCRVIAEGHVALGDPVALLDDAPLPITARRHRDPAAFDPPPVFTLDWGAPGGPAQEQP